MSSKREMKRAARAAEKRQLILDAAMRVVARQGYASASVARIAAEAGVAHGSIYSHFPTRQALLDQLLPLEGRALLQHLAVVSQGSRSYFGLERRAFAAVASYMEAHPHFLRVLTEAEIAAPASFTAHMNAIEERYLRSLRRAADEGEVRRYDETMFRVIAQILSGARGHLAVGYSKATNDGYIGALPDWAAETYVKFIKHGLAGEEKYRARISFPPPLRPTQVTIPPARSDTRSALLDAAAGIILDRGFARTTVQDITARAGLAVGTFYNYFETTEELLGDLLTRSRECLFDYVRRRVHGSVTFVELEIRGFHAFFDYVLTDPAYCRVESEAAVWVSSAYHRHFHIIRDRYVVAMEKSAASDQLTGFTATEFPLIATILMAARHYLAAKFFAAVEGERIGLDEIRDAYSQMICFGLAVD